VEIDAVEWSITDKEIPLSTKKGHLLSMGPLEKLGFFGIGYRGADQKVMAMPRLESLITWLSER
jgi:hypothetical protein